MKYLFDVDGTLTPHHGSIDEDFKQVMIEFARNHEVYFVTGSTPGKSLRQLGPILHDSAVAVYNLNGSMKTKHCIVEYLNKWEPSPQLIEFLEVLQQSTKWKDVYTRNIEIRDTMVNFSIVGRDCTPEARQAYFEWDQKEKERETICRLIKECYPGHDVVQGGQISVDISPVGTGKCQILDDVEELGTGELCFIGDKMQPGGNDYSLAKRIVEEKRGIAVHVDDWQETLRHIGRIE